jgi:inner membrane protein
MDNVTHSIVGLAAGELVHRALPEEKDVDRQRMRRKLLLMSSWLASNVPDLDLVLTPLLPAPLGYLLHHRGHTHTLLYSIPQALLIWGAIWVLWPSARRLLKESASARRGFAISLIVGLIIHLLMDYLNSYGLHPFHPFDSRWIYGDMVFIVEPLFWVALGVPLVMTIRRQWLKGLLLFSLIGALSFFTLAGFLSWMSLSLLALLALALGIAQHKAATGGTAALVLAVTVSIGFVGVQNMASRKARALITADAENRDVSSEVLDISLNSFPSNPVCWIFISIESKESAGFYRLRRGVLSLVPEMLPVSKCPAGFLERPHQLEATSAIALLSEQKDSLDSIRRLRAENCYFEAWLRFARAPSISESQASDMRFDFAQRENFTTIDLEELKNRDCSPYVPGWGFPRADLLDTPPVQE